MYCCRCLRVLSTACLGSLYFVLLSGCGSSTSSSSQPPPPQPSITIIPNTALVPVGTNEQFFAKVLHVSGNKFGYYVAPVSMPAGGKATVTATSTIVPNLSAFAEITISSQPISISISPSTATVKSGFTTAYRALVDGTSNSAVLWRVTNLPGDDSYPGMIFGGNYTAPNPLLAPHLLD